MIIKFGKYRRFVKNIDIDELHLYQKALDKYIEEKEDVKYSLYLVDDATTMFGRRLPDMYALECTKSNILPRFWEILNEVELAPIELLEELVDIEDEIIEDVMVDDEPVEEEVLPVLQTNSSNDIEVEVPTQTIIPSVLQTFDVSEAPIYEKAINTFHMITNIQTFSIATTVIDIDTDQPMENVNALLRIDHTLNSIDDFYTILNVLLTNK